MLVGVLSDTHDRLPMIDAALALFRRAGVEMLVHPGDFVAPFALQRVLKFEGPVHAVYGNNDGERAGLKRIMPSLQDGPLFVEIGGRTILVHHFLDWCGASDIARAEVVITGHTHLPVAQQSEGKLLLNPGECCGWVHGRCTVAILDTHTLTADIHDLETS